MTHGTHGDIHGPCVCTSYLLQPSPSQPLLPTFAVQTLLGICQLVSNDVDVNMIELNDFKHPCNKHDNHICKN